jgi:DNA-binding transcriptional ArsR family regulator
VESTATRLRPVRGKHKQPGQCEIVYVDERKVAAVRAVSPSGEDIERLAERFGALGDPTRIRILHALSRAELCVCDLSKVAGRSMPATSQQLQLLRRLGLVKYRMDGKLAYYTLADEWVRAALTQAMRSLSGGRP